VITRPCDQDSLAGRHVRALGALEFATELDLAALSDPEIVALAADRLELPEESMPAALARLICRRAGGNPFFAEELVLTLLEQGIISICIPAGPAQEGQGPKQRCVVCDDLARASSSLPGTVQELVLARVERLSPECQMVLKVASVIGRAFTYETLRRTLERFTGIEEATLNDYLNLLSMLDLVPRYAIEPELTYVFKHVIIQEVVYNTLLFAQRRVLHRAVAEVLEQQSPARAQESAALLAFHWAHSDQPEKAFSYLRAGGQEREGAVRNEVAFFQIDA
jgi:predicted ATPase